MPESPPGLTPGHDRLRLYCLDCFRLLALFGHGRCGRRCPLTGVERKSHFKGDSSVFDEDRTWRGQPNSVGVRFIHWLKLEPGAVLQAPPLAEDCSGKGPPPN